MERQSFTVRSWVSWVSSESMMTTVCAERWSRDVNPVAQSIRVTRHAHVPTVRWPVSSSDGLFDNVV
jgi:hypothetical protein